MGGGTLDAVPEVITPDNARWIALVAVAIVVVGMFLVVRFVQKLVLKAVLVGLLALVGLGLWVQRAELGDCVETCDCRLFLFDVEVPESANPNC